MHTLCQRERGRQEQEKGEREFLPVPGTELVFPFFPLITSPLCQPGGAERKGVEGTGRKLPLRDPQCIPEQHGNYFWTSNGEREGPHGSQPCLGHLAVPSCWGQVQSPRSLVALCISFLPPPHPLAYLPELPKQRVGHPGVSASSQALGVPLGWV